MNQTYYNDISDTLRSMVVWLDDLLRKPEDLFKMHEHHIHLIEFRLYTKTPFHKNKKIDAWVREKINTVASTYRSHKALERLENDLRREKNEHDE